jgi:large subunit ribosomal protein L17
MRHANTDNHLGRKAGHRRATLRALSNALIAHKRITTTLAKAKALRRFVEPILNRAKEDSMHNRREVFRHLQSKEGVKILFGEIATRLSEREGGYTRVVRLGMRSGDAAELALIELVDYNDVKPGGEAKGRRRRTRRGTAGKGVSTPTAAATAASVVAPVVEEAVQPAEAVAAAEGAPTVEAIAEAPVAEAVAPEAAAPTTEPAPEAPTTEAADPGDPEKDA